MTKPVRLRINLWLEQDRSILVGMGRYMLLDRIHALGSIKQAAQSLGMSYRAAWGKMKQTENTIGAPLIEKQGNNRTGCRLTPMGRRLMESYKAWLDAVEAFALEKAREKFDWPIIPFGQG